VFFCGDFIEKDFLDFFDDMTIGISAQKFKSQQEFRIKNKTAKLKSDKND
jgi:hypothetical protein